MGPLQPTLFNGVDATVFGVELAEGSLEAHFPRRHGACQHLILRVAEQSAGTARESTIARGARASDGKLMWRYPRVAIRW